MARKPTLSPSKISLYLACPVKYRWTYLDPKGKWYIRSKKHFSFGLSLHAVLQRFHDAGDAGVTTTHEAVAALEESWIEAGYSSPEEMTQALAEGKQIVERYVELAAAAPVTSKTLFVEKMLRHDLSDFVLLGRLDRLDELEDGTLDIVDYKSGREAVHPEDVQTDLAMGIYQLLVRAHYPDQKVQASIIALRTGSCASASLSDEEVNQLREDLVELGSEILNRDFESITPIVKPLCETCDFLPLCRQHPDFNY